MTDSSYPVDLQIERPEKSSRGWAALTLLGIKSLTLIPQIIVLYIFMIGVGVVFFISQIAVLFTEKYPEGWHAFMVKVMRWQMQVSGFMYGLRDDYPPFAPSEVASSISITIPYPEQSSRGWAIMTMLGIKSLALIPQIIVLYFVMIAMAVVWVIGEFAVLFTGVFPEGMHRFVVGTMRWMMRLNAFMYGLCDQYPPFSMS